ncbi:class I SAM-dependent methyltransferase [Candidatus Woesearchaeota archaeon]|nr:class I SAM-dependent methyltransferase [Candidatus Woesearchaeota archaeon]
MSEGRFSGKVAEEYEFVRTGYPHYDEFQTKLGADISSYCADLEKDEIYVLEIGSGTGLTTEQILLADPRIIAESIDNEQAMLEQAYKHLAGRFPQERYNIREGDVREELDPDSMTHKSLCMQGDIVATAWTLHNLKQSERRQIYRGIKRLLHPGGLFVNADKIGYLDESRHYSTWIEQSRMIIERCCAAGRIDKAVLYITHNLEDNMRCRRLVDETEMDMLRSIGFVDVSITYRHLMEGVMVARKPMEGERR